jgi:GNAT superfamily N-acetyltransferase
MITLTTVDGLTPADCLAIGRRLCHPHSEFQLEVLRRMSGEMSSSTPICLWHGGGALLAWAASHEWRGMQTLEMFTDERHRGRGIAVALSAAMYAAGVLERDLPLAVFAPLTEEIARRLGFEDVQLFAHDWKPVE